MKSCNSIKLETPARAYALLLNSLCTDLKIPRELANVVNGHARSRSYANLVGIADQLASQMYASADEHFRMNQLAFFIKKVPFVDPGLNPGETALAKFHKAEHRMKRVNQKFALLNKILQGRTTLDLPREGLFLLEARRFIARVLGPLKLAEVYGECYMGDGSAVSCRGAATHVVNKMRMGSVTATALPYVIGAFHANASLRRLAQGGEFSPFVSEQVSRTRSFVEASAQVVDYNLVDFVPKDAKTHRGIALEPSFCGFLQLGAGRVIASRLKRVGCDITDQGKNQAYAKFGSTHWEDAQTVATLDLASASDSLSCELVKALLPEDWYEFLNAIRSPGYRITEDSQTTRYQKFASMGNGFCFPLQSLVYLSIVRTVLRETGDTLHAVYGDDIIVPRGAALLTIERLRYCGFRTNVDKTFVHGPFRESCGADFFGGFDVRPFVLDYLPATPVDYIKIANGIGAKLGLGTLTGAVCLYTLLPPHKRFVKPALTGAVDDAILVPLDEFMVSGFARWDRERQTWNFKVMTSSSSQDKIVLNEYEQLLALNHGAIPGKERSELCPGGQPAVPRRFTARYKGKWYLPDLKTLDAKYQRDANLWREDGPGSPAA